MSWMDLHLHSNASPDGEISPRGLAELCHQEKIILAALTDQNTTEGTNEFMWRGAQLGVRTVSGIELKCTLEGVLLDVLGYGIETAEGAFPKAEESVLPSVEQAIQAIHDAGGLAVLAHPGTVFGTDEKRAEAVLALPFDGIEVFSGCHDAELTAFCWTLADKHGLLKTGGSDFHSLSDPERRVGQVKFYNQETEIRDTLLTAIHEGPAYSGRRNKEERKMYAFEYTITDPVGLHARPAGELAKEAKKYASKVIICKDDKRAEATRLMSVMGMGVKCGDTVRVEVDGEDAEQAGPAVEAFFKEKF